MYRTEFLFLQRNELPDEDEQFHAYRDTVLGMSGRPVTIRTLDLGADKADRTGLTLVDEDNPALGLRGVRLSLARPAVAQTQLRAILRASGYGPVRILVPMVSGREEILLLRKQLKKLTAQLREEGHEIAEHIPLGAMIEVPAAALALDCFIDDIDFLSIGTNDLVQYLLAVDRNNEALGELYSPLHPAVLRLIAQVIATGAPMASRWRCAARSPATRASCRCCWRWGSPSSACIRRPCWKCAARCATSIWGVRSSRRKLLSARDRKGIENGWRAMHKGCCGNCCVRRTQPSATWLMA